METKDNILNELLKELSFYMVEYESEEEIKNKIDSYRQRWENAT